MLPWKVLIRAVGAVTLLSMGGLAAGGDIVPFSHVSRSVVTQAVVGQEEAAAPAAGTETTPAVDDEAPPADGGAVIEIELPDSAAPEVDEADAPGPTTPPVVEGADAPDAPVADAPVADAPGTDAPGVDAPATPPTGPAEDDAPVVCAAAAESACGPADPELAADARFDARVARCEAWWNRLADRLESRNRPRWAARAHRVAGRCEAIITRWQERRDDRQDRRDGREDRKVKGDHNCDGRPDNGWHNKPGSPFPCPDAARPTAPGQVRTAERHGEGRR